ncbi:MAG: hypothetical protein CMJ33_04955 [Phycisphaerae bacterium]|nr:hypothetical protein [Phycisphaerae bacterium]HAW95807.1 hypothetical protein [Phycisphaerales bacterium]|tara:strand:+ start:839 stop:1978 length:1140 start_codon:yes stop_codon:yes gene_type:complete
MDTEGILTGYCTNVHAGTTLEETIRNLEHHSVAVREHLELDRLGIGLWLPETALNPLKTRDNVLRLRDHLDDLGLFVFTMNGFPQRNFHADVVKHDVYKPDWTEDARFDYTRSLAGIVVDLVPESLHSISISTVPVGWDASIDLDSGPIERLTRMAAWLSDLEQRTGRCVHVDLEPEPGCFLDRAEDVVALFERLPESCRRHLRVCHDICHSAVMFEAQRHAIETYRSNGILVGKIQVSSCPEIDFSSQSDEKTAALRDFMEERYLHQTVVQVVQGDLESHHLVDDLDLALETQPRNGLWRVHFHVPIFADRLRMISTTQGAIAECLEALGDDIPPLEVETYAWNVLPEHLVSLELSEGIAKEIAWLHSLIRTRDEAEP